MAARDDRVKDTSTTTGTGDLTLSGAAPSGFQTFNATIGQNIMLEYAISGGAEWETGFGYLSGATTLVRSIVAESSNAGALVNFSAGTKDVFCTLLAESIVDLSIAMALNAGSLLQ